MAASVQWYDDVFAALGIPATRDDGLWVAGGAPPRWHSAVKTLRPGVPTTAVLDALAPFPRGTAADSFGDQDLRRRGFRLIVDAQWLHREAAPAPAGPPAGWRAVHDPAGRAAWNESRDTDVPSHPRIALLGRWEGGRLMGGTVLHEAGGVLGVSNTWNAAWDEVLELAAALHPGVPLTAYAADGDLEAAVAAGFAPVGPQRVWTR